MKTVRAMLAGALIALVAGGAGLFLSRSESPLPPRGADALLTLEFEGNEIEWKVYINPDTGVWELRRNRK